jgi:putative membrane protein
MADALIAYVHYLAMMLLMAALVTEHVLLGSNLELRRARQLATTDLIYVAAAAAVLLTGLLRLLYFGKGAAFYFGNPLFHAKLTLFVVAALLSVYPSVQIAGWRAGLKAGHAPQLQPRRCSVMRWLIRFEMLAIALIPLLAVLMGRGFGY